MKASDKEFVEGDVSIWCAGIRPAQLVERLRVPKFRGWIAVDEYLRCGEIFAAGDCAFVRIGKDVATKTVLEARSQGKHVAENVIRLASGRGLKRYRIRSSERRPIAIITLGRGRAVMVYRGALISRPMAVIYRIKKFAVKRFVQIGKNSK